jgi:hypothetical protein
MRFIPALQLARCLIAATAILGAVNQPSVAEDSVTEDSVAEDSVTEDSVDFVRDIQPLLADRCFACHGPDANARQAELRLDFHVQAIESAIVPGNAADSELVQRITSDDPDQRMPPTDANKSPITEQEAELIRRWIDDGAEYTTHWAFRATASPAVPELFDGDRNSIDAFVRRRLDESGLQRSPPVDKRTLIRRVSFDLTGLPPTPAQVRAFLNDDSPVAYEQLVDRLLDSSHYGERMALYWLDVVRYADTNGIHSDVHRDHASYRDYVIKAFNDNLPFDRFVIEQLAGDLLSNATDEQRIASGFNRLNMTTEEGGAQPKEYTAIYAADRVRNTGSIFMGTTIGCAQCHDHKFDPFTTRDFYSFAAFFADVQEVAVGNPKAVLLPRIAHDEADAARLAALQSKVDVVQQQLDTSTPELVVAQAEWEPQAREQALRSPGLGTWSSVGPFIAEDSAAAFRTEFVDEHSENIDRSAKYQDDQLAWQEQEEWSDGAIHELNGENAATYLVRNIHAYVEQQLELSLGSDDAIRVWLNGQLVLEDEVFRSAAADQNRVTIQLRPGDNQLLLKIVNKSGDYGFYFQALGREEFPGVDDILRTTPDDRNDEQQAKLAAYHRSITPILAAARVEMTQLQEQQKSVNAEQLTLVSMSVEPRTVRILPRGDWLDESGEVVQPATPAFLGGWSVGDRRGTRKDLADWLVSPDNPLTARVFVNRLWKLAFGHGLVRSLDDFGAQGQTPSHPELLDWLTESFIDSGWNVKHLMKLLIMSETYRQSSMASAELAELDPLNSLYARQSRFRLDAEMVRDNALAISGLLVPRIGGPSVKPYQPAGYWAHLYFPAREWEHDRGQDLYRRGLYTYWCRTFLHPAMLAFDAPTREECTVERPRSNTPLAALVLLNDPCYVEAARALAANILRQGGGDTTARVQFAFDQVLQRTPDEAETSVLASLYEKHLAGYQADPDSAAATQTVGELPPPDGLDPAELAAWTSVARTILNLHETITRY